MNFNYLVLEGPDFSGKSSLREDIENHLREVGRDYDIVREPGGTALGEQLRSMVLNVREEEPISSEAELFIMLASRAQLIQRKVLPALEAGKLVLSERGGPSTQVYQCHDEALRDTFRQYTKIACPLNPLYIFLELDYDTYVERSSSRGELDEIEKRYNSRAKYEMLLASYRQAAERETNRVIINVVGKTREQVLQEVLPYIDVGSKVGE